MIIPVLCGIVAISLVILILQNKIIRNQTREINRLYNEEQAAKHYDSLSDTDRDYLRKYMQIVNKERA